jgi:hypothetical protein
MHLSRNVVTILAGVALLAVVSCSTIAKNKQKGKCLKTAVAFYKALANPTADTEKGARDSLGLSDYRLYGFPALIYGSLGFIYHVKPVAGTDNYEVPIKFWCEGKDANGATKKIRRTLVVRVAPNPSSSTGWSVSEFTFRDEKPLTYLRQILTWLLWIILAPVLFSLVLGLLAGGLLGARVALTVGQLMSLPIQVYVSYLCFGTVGRAVIAIAILIVLNVMSVAARQQAQNA